MTSSLIDIVWNRNEQSPYSISLLDDTIFFNVGTQRLNLESIRHLNSNFGFELNPRKTQLNTRHPEWAGFCIMLDKKEIKLLHRKIQKMNDLIQLIANQKVKRRQFASILGKIYSARVIALAYRVHFSSLTILSRQFMFQDSAPHFERLKNLWFFKDMMIKLEYKEFFDTVLPLAPREVVEELRFAVSICSKKASFSNVRKYIFSLNELPVPVDITHYCRLYTDSSDYGYGIFIYFHGEKYATSGQFSEYDRSLSINVKEFFALVLGVIICAYIDYVRQKKSHFIAYVDNTASQMLAISKKCHIRNKVLAKLSWILSMVQFSANSEFFYHRISSSENSLADDLSRKVGNDTALLGITIEDLLKLI